MFCSKNAVTAEQPAMTEDEFWSKLEYRVCQELVGMEDKDLKYMWCDGITGYVVRPEHEPTYISGTVWLGNDGQTEMQLTMALPHDMSADENFDWDKLFPPGNITHWLCVDLRRKQVSIDLSKAEPLK